MKPKDSKIKPLTFKIKPEITTVGKLNLYFWDCLFNHEHSVPQIAEI